MKRFPFLLLDAGPIIKLFELGIWDDFITKCDVAVSRTVADEARYASREFEDISIDLGRYEEQRLINVFDVELSKVKAFHEQFDPLYKVDIHPGEKETLAFSCNSSEDWRVCSADHVVFRVLGRLNKGAQGISLEEILTRVGLGSHLNWRMITPRDVDWKYTKKFRERWTHRGQVDFIQS